MTLSPSSVVRCEWAGSDPLMVAYHDEEWGVPCHDDRDLFERLILEGFQAGLSWSTILRKRQAFIRAFDGFDPEIVAGYGPDDVARLLDDAGIVRNRLKVAAAISNAQAFLETRRSVRLVRCLHLAVRAASRRCSGHGPWRTFPPRRQNPTP